MFAFLALLAVTAPAAVVAVVVLAVRAPGAFRRGRPADAAAAPSRGAWRRGMERPVGRWLIAAAAAAAVATTGAEVIFLATVGRGPGWGFDIALLALPLGLLAVLGWAALAGLTGATVSAARGFGPGAVAGLLTVAAVAVGALASHLPVRAAYVADPDRFPSVPNLGEGDLLVPFEIALVALVWAIPWPVLGAALGARSARGERREPARDLWQVLLDLATSDLPRHRSEWGAALRAELAAIDPPAERRRFAVGGIKAALRSGTTGAWVVLAGAAVATGAGTLAASRWSLAHGRGGVLSFWMAFPTVVLLAVGLATAWRARSFGTGLRAGAMGGLGALAGTLSAGLPEAVVWADEKAGYLTTGDAVPPDWQSAVLDVLRPEFVLLMMAFWSMSVVGGAALGTAIGHLRPGADRLSV